MHSERHVFGNLLKKLDREAAELEHRRAIVAGLPPTLSRPPCSVQAKGHRAQGQLRFEVPGRQAAIELAEELPPQLVYLFVEAHGMPTIGPLCSFKTPPENRVQVAEFVFRTRHSSENGAESCIQWWSMLNGVSVQIMADLPQGDILVERLDPQAGGWAVHGVPAGNLVQWGRGVGAHANALTVYWHTPADFLSNLMSRHTVDLGFLAENVSFRTR